MDRNLLTENGIQTIVPASRRPLPDESMTYTVLDHVEAGALINGDGDMVSWLEVCDMLAKRLEEGQGILLCCMTGAHKSAALACGLVMYLTGTAFDKAETYLCSLRNCVDLSFKPPGRSPRSASDWLLEWQDRILAEAWTFDICQVLSPHAFRKKAIQVGFEAMHTRPKAKAAKTGSGEQDPGYSSGGFEHGFSTVSSQELNSSMESEASWGFTPSLKRSLPTASGDGFLVLKDELASKEMRAAKLNQLCADLEALDSKMMVLLMPADKVAMPSVAQQKQATAEPTAPNVKEQGGLNAAAADQPEQPEARASADVGQVAAADKVPATGQVADEPVEKPADQADICDIDVPDQKDDGGNVEMEAQKEDAHCAWTNVCFLVGHWPRFLLAM